VKKEQKDAKTFIKMALNGRKNKKITKTRLLL